MEIQEIKSHLTISHVLDHYNLKADRNNMLCCPFHEDKTPSLQIYPQTNTYCCFSSNCSAGTGDVIEFIRLMERTTKHEAILKAISMISANQAHATTETNHAKLFKVFEGNLKKSGKAQDYLKSRGLTMEALEAGFNGTAWPQMKECVIFPLKDKDDRIVSLYGRSINARDTGRHYYSKDRKGLYPRWPRFNTQVLVLTESVIDAATLYQWCYLPDNVLPDHAQVLACYGTNGFTQDHEQAVKELKHLQEIIIFFDGDDAGKEGAERLAEKLQKIVSCKISIVPCPEGEDINSLVQSHEREIFRHLLNQRKPHQEHSEKVFFSPDSDRDEKRNDAPAPATGQRSDLSKLDVTNPELLYYRNGVLNITVLGGIRITGMDRMRVTLKLESKVKDNALPLRHNLDLYNKSQVDQLITQTAENLEVSTLEATHAIAELTADLEHYRERKLEALKPKKEERRQLTEQEKREALEYLKSKDLLKQTALDIARSGIVGEKINSLIAWLTYTSRKRERPLHLMCLGASGTGKTYLQERVSQLIPEEDRIEITALSENAFYYFGQEELKHKLILIEDIDGAENVLYPLRELQSKTSISKTVTLKDNKGNLKTITLKVEGPVSVSSCTTREKVYEDNANRCILIYIDTTPEQDKRIMEYQQQHSAGVINRAEENKIKEKLKNVQRILRPITVHNPYAQYINLPEAVFKPRRTMLLLLSFIETITFYHQYQREVKHDEQTGEMYIESTAQDAEYAFKLLKEVLFSKSDELTGACRKFFEQLKTWLKQEEKQSFHVSEIRKSLRLNPSNLKRYLSELSRYYYIRINGGSKYKGFEYQVTDFQEYEQLKSDIDQKLEGIVQKIKS